VDAAGIVLVDGSRAGDGERGHGSVFAKDDSTGVRGHSTRRRGSKGQRRLFSEGRKVPVIPASVRMNRDLVNNHHRSPLFFASVDSKGG